MPRAISLEITKNVVDAYDSTKTTVLGRAAKKILTLNQGGKTVVGTPLNNWADTTSDGAITPVRNVVSENGHELFFVASTAAGVCVIALYDVDEATGVRTYVGKISAQLPSTTHTFRGMRLYNDSGATGWRIVICTVGTVAASGGLFSLENIAKTDFAPVLPTSIPVATGVGQKAVYWHQEPGGTNNLTVAQGMGVQKADTPSVAGDAIYVANGLVATPNFYYFNAATAISAVGVGGVTTDWFVHKTGIITGLTGTFLLLNNYTLCVPTADSGAPVALQGQLCLFVPGSTGFGLGKVSELTNGATSWPSYATADTNNAPNTSVAQTPVTAHFSQTLQRIVFQLSAGRWVVKKFMNASYDLEFGCSSNPQYRTNQSASISFYEFGAVAFNSTFMKNGWLYYNSSTVGQIGGGNFDLRSLFQYDYSKVISKVIDVEGQWLSFSINTPVRSFGKFYYRTNLTCDFSDTTTGWVAMPEDRVLSGISVVGVNKAQFMINPRMERDSVSIPVQIIEAHLILQPSAEMSEFWDFSDTDSIETSPGKAAFSQVLAYSGSKHWEFFAYNRATGALVTQKNTQDHASEFTLSTNDGSSFGPVTGAIPSSPLLNVLAYNYTSPPGVKLRVALREKA